MTNYVRNIDIRNLGEVGVIPRIVSIVTNAPLATVTTAGWLLQNYEGYNFSATDIFEILYGSNYTDFAIMQPTFSNGIITLVPWVNPGNVVKTSVVSGDFANFAESADGKIRDFGYSPSDATKTKVAMVNGATVVGNVATYSDIAGTSSDSGLAVNTILKTSIISPDSSPDFVYLSAANISATLLNAGAQTLFTPSGSNLYIVYSIRGGGSGNTSFSGGGGDRAGTFSIGATAYGTLPAATMQAAGTLPYLLGGGATFIYAGAAATTSISSANPLRFAYSGGTTNYSSGNINFEILLIRTL